MPVGSLPAIDVGATTDGKHRRCLAFLAGELSAPDDTLRRIADEAGAPARSI
jgi:hypothetical protein